MVFRGPPTLTPDAGCLAIMQVNQQNSPLLCLPAELRQMIYNFALDINSGATPLTLVNGTDYLNIKDAHNNYLWLSRWKLCRASRQLFAETSKDYFEQKFIVAFLQRHVYVELEELEHNMESLSLDQRRAINEIRLDNRAMLHMKFDDTCPLLHLSNLRLVTMRWYRWEWVPPHYHLHRLEEFLRQKLGHNVGTTWEKHHVSLITLIDLRLHHLILTFIAEIGANRGVTSVLSTFSSSQQLQARNTLTTIMAKGPPKLTPNKECLEIMQRNLIESPLLSLPTELRFMIYDFTMDTFSGDWQHDDYLAWDRLSLSLASRQLFAETAHDYFDRKLLPLRCLEVQDHDYAAFKNTMATFTPSQRNMIVRIEVTCSLLKALRRRMKSYCLLGLAPRLDELDTLDDEVHTRADTKRLVDMRLNTGLSMRIMMGRPRGSKYL